MLDEDSEDIAGPYDTPTTAIGRSASRTQLELERAYRRAVYAAATREGELRFAVGRASPRIDRLLAELGVAHAAFLTAENPGSIRLSEAENADRTAQLAARLEGAGFRIVAGESRDRRGDWREVSFLVPGIESEAALALARELGQAAFVWLESGRPPTLVTP